MRKVTVRVASVLFALLLLLFPITYSLSTVFAAGPVLSLSPASGNFNKGCTFSVEIKLDTAGSQTDGTDAILIFDPTRVTTSTTAIRPGTIYSTYPGSVVDTQGGKVTIPGLASPSSPFTGSGTLATVDFTVLESAPTGAMQIKFDFDPVNKGKTTDSNVAERGTANDILNQVIDGSYAIGSGACTAGATPTPSFGGGGIGSGSGGPAPTVQATPYPTKPAVLPGTADFNSTLVLTLVGGTLVVLGFLSAAFL